jgi:hypothetical protein
MTLAAILTAALVITSGPAEAAPDPVGRIQHYTRSNSDGSEAEHVSTYRSSATTISVYKMRERCTNAALVTAELDLARNRVAALVGGRLTRGGAQQAFAWLSHDADANTLTVSLEGPGGAALETTSLPGTAPWRLYDFDFADWNALMVPPTPGQDIAVDMALIWPEPAEDGRMMRALGVAVARFVGSETHGGVLSLRYRMEGRAFAEDSGGDLWLDARDGTVVEARFGRPSHPGYADFRLVRTGESRGETAWQALLADHWTGCPPA